MSESLSAVCSLWFLFSIGVSGRGGAHWVTAFPCHVKCHLGSRSNAMCLLAVCVAAVLVAPHAEYSGNVMYN